MGGLIQIPHLAIPEQPQQPQDPLEKYGQLLSIQKLAAGQQLQQSQIQNAQLDTQQKQLELAQQQRDAQDQQTMRAQAPNYVQKDSSGKVTGFDTDGYYNSLLGNSVSPAKVSALKLQNSQAVEAYAKAGIEKLKLADAITDNAHNILEGVRTVAKIPGIGPQAVQGAYQDALPQLQKLGIDTSKYPQNFAQVGDAGLQQFEATLGAHKQIIADAKTQAEINEKNANAGNSASAPLGDKLPQLNDALTQRYQVLHPGQPLPAPFTLGANATKGDFDRIDKILQSTEQAQGTKAQQDTSNAIRQQTESMMGTNSLVENGKNPDGSPHMSLLNTKTGVMSEPTGTGAATIQAKGTSAPTQQMKTSAFRANTALAGIPDVINDVDRMKDKLGPFMGRWNDFMQGKVGADDPDFAGLRADMGMLSTAVTLAHAQGRMSDSLKNDFSQMLNQPKQSPENIKAVLGKVQTWMERQSNINGPNAGKGASTTQTQQGGAQNQTQGGTGKAVSLAAAKQLPAMKGKTDDEIKALITAQGHTVAP